MNAAASLDRPQLFSPGVCPLLVVKIGSALLVQPDGQVRRGWLETLVADIAARRVAGQRIVVVCSGAIALGARRLGFEKGGRASLADAQASASVGQIILSGLWSELLGTHGLTAAQILITLDDLENRHHYLNFTATLNRLLEAGAVPVLNENDSVATEEIRFGDNDRMAARVAVAVNADGVILLSDVDGLYDRNPAEAGAVHISDVHELTDAIMAMADGSSASGMGTGGMAVKLEAARIANLAGIRLAIASGKVDHPIASGKASGKGTVFHPSRAEPARKAWLGGLQSASGQLNVDDGAVQALRAGKSLLAAGVTAISGDFTRGDVVDIADAQGVRIARGLCEYEAAEARAIMGQRSEDIAPLLGYAPRSAMVHRDHLVIL